MGFGSQAELVSATSNFDPLGRPGFHGNCAETMRKHRSLTFRCLSDAENTWLKCTWFDEFHIFLHPKLTETFSKLLFSTDFFFLR